VLRSVTLVALSPVEMAAVTVPLALFLMLAETAVGTYAATEALRVRGGLTPGFLKFMAVTSTVLTLLALLVILAAPVSAYREVLPINRGSAGVLAPLQALTLVAVGVVAISAFRSPSGGRIVRPFALLASAGLLVAVATTFAPLGVSWWGQAAIWASVLTSTVVLGTATTGMLLGHWYLVTPALTNRPLLRSIAWLLAALIAQTVVFLVALAGLRASGGSPAHPLATNPILSLLWTLGAVTLPLLAAALALAACRIRSFMSTTGLLYLAMIAIFPGQLVGQLLFFVAAR
jgi:hypothetical protein